MHVMLRREDIAWCCNLKLVHSGLRISANVHELGLDLRH